MRGRVAAARLAADGRHADDLEGRSPALARAALGLLALALIGLATPARADEEGLHLTWGAPPGCPTSDTVRTAALRNAPAGAALDADGRIEHRGSLWHLTLRTRRGTVRGERQLDAPTCQGAADAAAVLLALALLPPGVAAETTVTSFAIPARAPAPATPASAAPAPVSPPARPVALAAPVPASAGPDLAADPAAPASSSAPAPLAGAPPAASPAPAPAPAAESASPAGAASVASPSSPHPHRVAVGAAVAADASTLPGLAVGGAVAVAWIPNRLRFELEGRRWASQSGSVASSPAAGARFTMTSVGARGCFAALRARFVEGSPCAGADVDFIDASGFGAQANYGASAQWTTVAGGALVRAPLTSWFALRLRAEAFVPLTRPTFVVEGQGDVHRPPILGTAASFGAEVLFL